MPTAPQPGVHDPERGITKGMPNFDLADTPYRLDPAVCKHGRQFPGDEPHGMRFVGTQFKNNAFAHEVNDLFRCDDCGFIHKVARDMARAGRKGYVDIDDPRVFRRLRMSPAVDERFFKQFNDGRRDFVRGAELSS